MKYLVTLRVHFSALLPTPLGDNCNQLHSNRAQNCLLVGPNLTFFFTFSIIRAADVQVPGQITTLSIRNICIRDTSICIYVLLMV